MASTSKFVELASVIRLVKYARECAKYSPCADIWFNELLKWLNDPTDIEPIEISEYLLNTIVIDDYQKDFKDDILKVSCKNNFGLLSDLATLKSIEHDKMEYSSDQTVYTHGVLAAKLPKYLIWEETLKED